MKRKIKRICDTLWSMDLYGYVIPTMVTLIAIALGLSLIYLFLFDEMASNFKLIYAYGLLVFMFSFCMFFGAWGYEFYTRYKNRRWFAIVKYMDDIILLFKDGKDESEKADYESLLYMYEHYKIENCRSGWDLCKSTCLLCYSIVFTMVLLYIFAFVFDSILNLLLPQNWEGIIGFTEGYNNHIWWKCLIKDIFIFLSPIILTSYLVEKTKIKQLYPKGSNLFRSGLSGAEERFVYFVCKSDKLNEVDKIIRTTYKKTPEGYNHVILKIHSKLTYVYLFLAFATLWWVIYIIAVCVYWGLENVKLSMFFV